MKLYNAEQIRSWDEYSMQNEPIESIDLMERAAGVFTDWLEERIQAAADVHIVCGPGNNGGDGLVIARLLAYRFHSVTVHLCHISSSFSEDNQTNQERLPEDMDLDIRQIHEDDTLPDWDGDEVLVDAIFGSGLSRPVEGYWAELIDQMNDSGCSIYAVDVPSGLYSDRAPEGTIVQAKETLSFQIPKRSFLHAESSSYTGRWTSRSIGLHPSFSEIQETSFYYSRKRDIRKLLSDRIPFSHKGSYGHSLLICGSTGMLGAAQLAARAALRAGSGKVTLHCPAQAVVPLQTAVPELMLSVDEDPDKITELPDLEPYNVIAMGCGIGKDWKTESVLETLLEKWPGPLVLDADALNLLSNMDGWEQMLPTPSVLTPHPGEFDRLFGKSQHSFERLEKAVSFCQDYEQYLVLKGAHTRIVTPEGNVHYNSSGNAGLATAGSGDVLTGMITAWMAQGYDILDACLIAVFQHGAAADQLLDMRTEESVIASDLIEEIPYIFKNNTSS